jgi:hypothetical protein
LTLEAPPSRPLRRLTPSLLEPLTTCRMRVSFLQVGVATTPSRPPAARLGDLCHLVLDQLVATGTLLGDRWEAELEQGWCTGAANESLLQSDEDLARYGPPEAWPHYALKRARLTNLARRVRQLLIGLPGDAQVLTEQELTGRGGLLAGRADLVIRSASCHVIADYKSGTVIETLTREMIPAYERQLQLYAALERETFGEWPDKALLMPLNAPPIEVAIEARQCDLIADDAVARLQEYNRLTPAPQPASPSPTACGRCPASCQCPALWETYSPAWVPEVVALMGKILTVSATPLGGVALRVSVESGVGGPIASVRGLREADHPIAGMLQADDVVAFVGLREDADRSAFYLPLSGRLARTG